MQRTLLNPGDLVDPNTSKEAFKAGTWARLGDVEIFHSYKGQSGHGHYDGYDVSSVKRIDDWNGLWGARDAIAQSIKVIDFWKSGTRWEDGPKAWAEACFKVSPLAKPANNHV